MTNPSLLRGAQTGDGQPTSPAAGVVPILKQIAEGQLKVVGTGFFVNPLVQKSLDVVRVIGNEAVHPGVMDLKDDRDTATKLFILVNLIAEQMISHPKHVNQMFEELPQAKRDAIVKRNDKSTPK